MFYNLKIKHIINMTGKHNNSSMATIKHPELGVNILFQSQIICSTIRQELKLLN